MGIIARAARGGNGGGGFGVIFWADGRL